MQSEESKSGWGYQDTRFETQPGDRVKLTGTRYALAGQVLPQLLPWFSGKLGVRLTHSKQFPGHYPPRVPPSQAGADLLAALTHATGPDQVTIEDETRLRHGHGHTASEIWAIRSDGLKRVPDVVVYPESAEQVLRAVEAAAKHGATIIPYGGGTNVTWALKVPPKEERPVISLGLGRMRRCLELDEQNHTATFEAGVSGKDLENFLAGRGFTLGHEPDSLEFSTLGGWVATNASGMKKNRYGNIEDLVQDISVVTSHGSATRPLSAPRESIGVRPLQYFLGSEGNLGVITSVKVKIRRLPEVKSYASVVFRDLKTGYAFLRDLQLSGVIPASVRLMDNTQFQFGLALKPDASSSLLKLKSRIEKLVVTQLKGFSPDKLCAATFVFEGTRAEVALQKSVVAELTKRHGGIAGGSGNGERGYQLTFAIAYIRDLAFDLGAIAESFETSVGWSEGLSLYERVEHRVTEEHARLGLPGKPFFSGRFTQIYETGVCIYFYLGFHTEGVADPVTAYEKLEHAARDEILKSGGALSHHHGIGKIREEFLPRVYSAGSLALTQALKSALDPENLFGAANHGVSRQKAPGMP
jgi:alkyldihydroxyacetonephosphate synthase